ncbi:type IV pili methyl-accepting chemotaxis transducer N-terminal domain-containing protein [uncultured Tenacibaculum sp.]|uniref:type IV pili methyl-accepting chemotaxis transducer N-terminal domain-containing protein n=1 Tax=uncultured Tenacibaculum sp. TaxID=174713 RepID=UPI00261F8769|nr:type IV pili methyl-accepting chemotaxis transducer N-terminal domain-containing protein [uncultured Tenacibaculum sp.]
MRKRLKNIVLTLILLLTIHIGYGQSSNKYGALTYNKAVNISGKQRMLTQRMGKIYLYLLSNPNDFKAKKDLKITKIIFEKQNSILAKNTEASLTKERIKEVTDTWEKYKKFLASQPNKDDAVKIINTNSTILKYANNVVNAIILESKGKTDGDDSFVKEEDSELKAIINKSGRQRMLSQRLALYYYASKPELKNAKIERNLKSVYTEIDNALNDLLISSFNNERIDEALGDVSALWETVKTNEDRLFKQGYEDKEMYNLSNQLTKSFNKITNLYEKVRIE